MSTFLDKSKQNLDAGELLVKSGLPNPSVHCAYYATVQFMFHILFKKLLKNKDEFDSEKRNNKEGSHSWAEKLISIELAKKSFEDYKWYKSKFPELKRIRESADYSELAITKDMGLDALGRSQTLINTLNSNFK
jgi:hypothetical protein